MQRLSDKFASIHLQSWSHRGSRHTVNRMHARALILVLVIAWFATSPANATTAWRAPTSGAVTRPFAVADDRFARGNHRGADFAAARGAPVRAVCSGRVVVASRIGSSGGVVTVACGPWRVSHLPLAMIGPRVDAHISAGDPIGTADSASAHDGIHVGVRLATESNGYVDPLRFIRRTPPTVIPVMGPATAPRARTPEPRIAAPRHDRTTAAAPSRSAVRVAAPRDRPLAPWPAWAAVAGLLLAVTTRGIGRRARRRRNPARTRPALVNPALATPARDDLRP
jgi:hypothetical protein